MGVASIIGIVNQKGGTGKTTTCVNLGVDLAHEGKKVLLVDCDPQGSLTISLGHPQPDALSYTLTDQMTDVLNEELVKPSGTLYHEEGVDLLPANICVNEIGDLIKPHYVTESFPKLLKAKGMRQIRYHDLRHSCASLLLANDVPLKQIQEWLGHSDIGTTANIYSHLD